MKTEITTKAGTVFTMDGETVSYKKGSVKGGHHISYYKLPEEIHSQGALREWERKNNKTVAWVCMPVVISSDETELCAAIAAMRQAYDEKLARKREADETIKAQHEAQRQQAIADCPAGFIPAVYKSSYDGIVTFSEIVSGAECQAWDDTYEPVGGGIYYIPSEKFDSDRNRKSRQQQATEQAGQEARELEDNAFRMARETGTRQKIKGWVTDRCMKRDRECSFDNATLWANPDGTKSTTYSCCY